MGNEKCFFCGNANSTKLPSNQYDGDFYNCPICGKYILECSALGCTDKQSIAGYLYNTKSSRTGAELIHVDAINDILNNEAVPKNINQQSELLLKQIYLTGDVMSYRYINTIVPQSVYSIDICDVEGVIRFLHDKKYITYKSYSEIISDGGGFSCGGKPPEYDYSQFRLTSTGIDKAEELLNMNSNNNKQGKENTESNNTTQNFYGDVYGGVNNGDKIKIETSIKNNAMASEKKQWYEHSIIKWVGGILTAVLIAFIVYKLRWN